MNAVLEQTIIEHLHALDEARLAEVLDFVEFLRQRTAQAPAPLTGLFSQESTPDDDALLATLAELRRERADNLERGIALIQAE